jgi:lipoprotein signal peptidase
MTDRSFRGLFFALALTGLLLDQASKYIVFGWLHNTSYEIIPGMFNLEAHHDDAESKPLVNQGALFGFLRDQKEIANYLFAGISIAAAAAIVFWATMRSTSRDWSLSAALGLILAGTLGNLYDRVVFAGVRDFLHFHYRSFDWPVFNVADVCLVCGAFLLLTQALFSRTPADRPVLEMRQPVEMTSVGSHEST